ncbi:hypothetical protein [Novosphingobium jiangmenense]|uniref:PEP-CTERM protein-sorting domain-containing protein n=1 Tax=Novosphingobium jiangmenense TaxID=2791981 RepID=A0ABS0HCI4_9SPHN|nr:hypothetical protein [Novosphingobium jiangmenense]MBF9149676.1 hypothetical protein [Novosphingobium jiangmenense]
MNKKLSIAAKSAVTLVGGLLLAMSPAHAVVRTVTWTDGSGVSQTATFDFNVVQGALNDASVQTALIGQPWSEDGSIAAQFAAALGNDLGIFPHPGEGGSVSTGPVFYALQSLNQNGGGLIDIDGAFFSGDSTYQNSYFLVGVDPSQTILNFATASSVAIPEIDGAKLPVALFIVLAFALWMQRRRAAARTDGELDLVGAAA